MSQFPPPIPPIPVQSIEYPTPLSGRRPGLITAIGVFSLIIGILGVFANGALSLQAVVFYNISRSINAMAAASTQPASTADAGIPEDGMTPAERAIVAEGLSEVRPLTQPRIEQLDALLAETGHTIFLLRDRALTPRSVHANVNDSSHYPGVGGREGPDVFIVGEGRMEIYDDHAVFVPTRGGDPTRVEGGLTTDASGNRILATTQVEAIVNHVKNESGNPLTLAQINKLRSALSAPGQKLITPANSPQAAASQIRYASNNPGGDLFVSFQTTGITITPSGELTNWNSSGPTGRGTFASGKPFKINAVALVCAVSSSVIAGALNIYLIVAGSLVLRQSLSGRTHHRIYAWTKIPLELFAGFAWAWLWSAFAASFQVTSASAIQTQQTGVTALTIAGLSVGLLGCLYPVILLIALRTKTIRDYYTGVWQ